MTYLEKNSSAISEQSIERRRHGRFPLHSPVRIVYDSDDALKIQLGQGVDFSASGVAFESDSDLNFYSALRLEYTDDDGENFCRTARLLYRVNRRYGAYFVDGEQV
ncbi:MAG: PilZ domain-containing protein [Candidatus Korobacteraceae bacterium]